MRIGDSQNNFQTFTRKVQGDESSSLAERIQNQISNIKDQIQKVSENKEMSFDAKQLKKKELNELLINLNKQLTQINLEEQQKEIKETSEKVKSTVAELAPKSLQQGDSSIDLASMQNLIAAGSNMNQINAASSVKQNMKGQANTLEDEINTDAARGRDVTKKSEALGNLKAGISTVSISIASKAGEINDASGLDLDDMNGLLKGEEAKSAEDAEKEKDKEKEDKIKLSVSQSFEAANQNFFNHKSIDIKF